MISKELLSEVFGKEIRDLDLSSTNSNKLNYLNVGDHWWYDINIYELAHKCKEWALKQGCILNSCEYVKDASCEVKHPFCEDKIFGEYKDFEADTEPEAVFKSCQWILDQKAKA